VSGNTVRALLALLLTFGCTGRISGVGRAPAASSGAAGTTAVGGAGTTGTGTAPAVESPSPRLLRQLTLSEYQNTVQDLLRVANVDTSAIPPDVTVDGFTTNVTGAFVSETAMDAYNTVASALGDRAVAEAYATLVPCTTQDAACAGTFVTAFGSRAFRRPLTSDEKARYLGFFDASLTGGDFKTGVGLVVKAMLVSPYFLFRSELGTAMGQDTFHLTPYETATSLAYTFWGTMPDDKLFASAASGALANKAELEAQARRLLADPRGRVRITSFFYEWMESPRAYVATKDPGTYPAFSKAQGANNAVVDAMRAEEDAFIGNVVFDSTKKFGELFAADYTFANDKLATYYGLAAPGSATTPLKVTLGAGAQRGGLLTLGMFLVGHGRTDESSPTQRGHMIRANMLCSDVPPPPPNVNTNITTMAAGQTGRDQIQALTGSGVCATCHTLMNPIGFGLEGFDSAGAQRTLDNGQPVDTTGVINGFTSSTGAPLTFDGPRELSNILAQSQDARRCFAASFHRYARGYAAKGVDLGAVQLLQQDFLANDLDLPELFVRVALQDSFVLRRSAEVIER
jgi:Protein of unknown function (DUF1592)/Protein of unknown function (DUF1588)/Protein of unknown function (DUF1595)/Protein of unknown function (DUF1587)/Protein of unknown function (DUF1585)